MSKFTKCVMTLAIMLVSGVTANASGDKVNLEFQTDWYCNANWNSSTKIFSWGTYPQDDWMDKGWTFMTVKNLSGDVTAYQKLVVKLEDFTNVVDEKLTIYFKENKGNTQSMDWVAGGELVPDASGVAELDLTTFVWKNSNGEDIDPTNIYDVTIYGGARVDNEQNGSVKVTEAWVEKPSVVLTNDVVLSPAAGWGTTVDVGVLTGNVAFNYINVYANVNLISTPVDLSEYPSYELVLADDAPVGQIQFCINYDTDTETNKTAWSLISTTTPAAVIPAGAIKLNSIGVQACNIENLGRVEIKSFYLIDKSDNKVPTTYEMPASWAATVIAEKGTMTFTTGGQWNYGSMTGAAGVKLPVTITISADALPADVQLNIGTSLVTGKNEKDEDVKRHEYRSWTAGDNTFSVEILPQGVNETIETIDIQNTKADNVCSIVNLRGFVTPATKTSFAVSEAGFASYSYFRDVDLTGVKGYKAKYASGFVALTAVADVPAGEGVVIEAAKGNYDFGFVVSAEDFSDNDLKVSNGTVEGDGTIYVLAKKGENAGFYKLETGKKVPAGKAYLVIPAGAPEFIAFEGAEVTGIETVESTAVANGVYFNLAGQRVAQPTKGLYIVNGKKVILK